MKNSPKRFYFQEVIANNDQTGIEWGGTMDFGDLEAFAEALQAKFALPGSASPEDQLKPEVASLLSAAGAIYGLAVATRTETHLSEHKVRPDIAVYVGGLICGYIELKAPGLGAEAPKLKGEHNKKQWEKLKGLPNLIYTDGREWALYRGGERPDGQPIVRLHDDPTEKGKAAATKDDAEALERLFRDFLGWQPAVPHSPSGLANYLAPLSRFLRSEVENALGQSGSAVELLANEWRQFFFPDADNAKFADAYAQTVTYAMLLARLSGAAKLDPAEAAKTLDKNNGLLARTLELLGHPDARKELAVGFEMLQRSLEALDPHDFLKSKPDLWLYFYEDFLAAYDPKLRKDYGVYYTPARSWNCRSAWLRNCSKSGSVRNSVLPMMVSCSLTLPWAPAPIPSRRSNTGWKRSARAPAPVRCPPVHARWQRTCTASRFWWGPMPLRTCV